MLRVTPTIALHEDELVESFVQAGGPGGQNVNKVATAVELRFDAAASPSLPEPVRARLLAAAGHLATRDGVIVIHARNKRSQALNRSEARRRLLELIRRAAAAPKRRVATKPGKAAKARARAEKTRQRARKAARRWRPGDD